MYLFHSLLTNSKLLSYSSKRTCQVRSFHLHLHHHLTQSTRANCPEELRIVGLMNPLAYAHYSAAMTVQKDNETSTQACQYFLQCT